MSLSAQLFYLVTPAIAVLLMPLSRNLGQASRTAATAVAGSPSPVSNCCAGQTADRVPSHIERRNASLPPDSMGVTLEVIQFAQEHRESTPASPSESLSGRKCDTSPRKPALSTGSESVAGSSRDPEMNIAVVCLVEVMSVLCCCSCLVYEATTRVQAAWRNWGLPSREFPQIGSWRRSCLLRSGKQLTCTATPPSCTPDSRPCMWASDFVSLTPILDNSDLQTRNRHVSQVWH